MHLLCLWTRKFCGSGERESLGKSREKRNWRHRTKKKKDCSLSIGQLIKKLFGVIWVYKVKHTANGSFQARLVAKGYSQHFGIGYIETFALVACLDSIRTLIIMAAERLVTLSAWMYKLRKTLYGFKQVPRAWYTQIDG